MIETGFGEDELSIDWDNLLETIPHDPSFDFVDPPNSGCSLSIDEIEQYLLDDKSNYAENDGQIVIEDGFSRDMLLELSPRSKDHPSTRAEPEKEKDKSPEIRVDDANQTKQNNPIPDAADDADDNNDAKKRKRQMRNRDAAVRSRERKKMYVKDLEMKTKYYEAECKRLGILLQCCLAENQALRFSLHSNKAFDGLSKTKQESAVLLMESLLLGSLLGLLGIIIMCLSIILSALDMNLLEKNTPELVRSLQAPRKAGTGNDDKLTRDLFHPLMVGKKYKASRSRIKVVVYAATFSSSLFAP